MENTIINVNTALQNIYEVRETTNYWMLRADGGKYFTDFFINSYIGIGWNELSVKQIKETSDDEIKEILSENNSTVEMIPITDDEGNISEQRSVNQPSPRSVSSWQSQLIRFVDEIKAGDIVIVPNEGSTTFNAFKVIDPAYDEDPNVISSQSENENYKHSGFKKRIRVSFEKSFNRTEVDSAIYPLLYDHHTLSNANDYKSFLNRVIFNVYKEHDNIHISFRVTETSAIRARSITKLLSGIIETVDATFDDEDVDSRLNVQSPGVVEIVLYSLAGIALISNIVLALKVATGGRLAVGRQAVKMALDDATKQETQDNHSPKNLDAQENTIDLSDGVTSASDLAVPFSELGITPSMEMTTIIEDAIMREQDEENDVNEENSAIEENDDAEDD